MDTGSQSDVSTSAPDVLEYESPAAGASGKRRGRQRLLGWLVVLAIIGALIALLLPPPTVKRTPAIETVNKSQAMQYMAALRQHFYERGTYPAKLDDLVPNYLPAVPPLAK